MFKEVLLVIFDRFLTFCLVIKVFYAFLSDRVFNLYLSYPMYMFEMRQCLSYIVG